MENKRLIITLDSSKPSLYFVSVKLEFLAQSKLQSMCTLSVSHISPYVGWKRGTLEWGTKVSPLRENIHAHFFYGHAVAIGCSEHLNNTQG